MMKGEEFFGVFSFRQAETRILLSPFFHMGLGQKGPFCLPPVTSSRRGDLGASLLSLFFEERCGKRVAARFFFL